jgi:hypothetical protein
MKRAVLYLRVSTVDQRPPIRSASSVRSPAAWAARIVKVYKGRDKRPAFDALCRDATKRNLTWSWPGRSTVSAASVGN